MDHTIARCRDGLSTKVCFDSTIQQMTEAWMIINKLFFLLKLLSKHMKSFDRKMLEGY